MSAAHRRRCCKNARTRVVVDIIGQDIAMKDIVEKTRYRTLNNMVLQNKAGLDRVAKSRIE